MPQPLPESPSQLLPSPAHLRQSSPPPKLQGSRNNLLCLSRVAAEREISSCDCHTCTRCPPLWWGLGLCRGNVPQQRCHNTSPVNPALPPGLGHLTTPEDKLVPAPPALKRNVSVSFTRACSGRWRQGWAACSGRGRWDTRDGAPAWPLFGFHFLSSLNTARHLSTFPPLSVPGEKLCHLLLPRQRLLQRAESCDHMP